MQGINARVNRGENICLVSESEKDAMKGITKLKSAPPRVRLAFGF